MNLLSSVLLKFTLDFKDTLAVFSSFDELYSWFFDTIEKSSVMTWTSVFGECFRRSSAIPLARIDFPELGNPASTTSGITEILLTLCKFYTTTPIIIKL